MPFPLLMALSLALAAAGLAGSLRFSPLIGLVCAAIILGIHGGVYFNVVPDDSYISFRYADNLAAGNGPVWNVGDRVEGYTNFLWVLLLSIGALADWSLIVQSQVMSFLATLGIFATVFLLAGVWTGPMDKGAREMMGVTTVLWLALSSPIAYWTFGGLETCFFTFLLTAAACLHLREERDQPVFYWSGPLFLLLALTRPEGVLLFAITAVFKLCSTAVASDRGSRLRPLVVWLMIFSGPFVAYEVWRWLYYGYPLPNTFYDKVAASRDQLRAGLEYVVNFGRRFGGLLFLALPFALLTSEDRRQPAYLVAIIVAWLGYVVYASGDYLRAYRMIVPVLPLALFLVVVVGERLFTALRAAQPKLRLLPVVGAASLIVAGASTLFASQDDADYFRTWDRDIMAQRAEIGWWLHDNAPPNYTIAISFAGVIPYYSQLPAIDMLGLSDKHIAHGPQRIKGYLGHSKWDGAYVLSRKPAIIFPNTGLLQDSFSPKSMYVEHVADFVFGDFGQMISSPSFWAEYQAAGVEIEPGKWFNFFLRRDSPLPGAKVDKS